MKPKDTAPGVADLIEKLAAQKVLDRKPPQSIAPERMRQKQALSHWLQIKSRNQSA